MSNSPSLTQPLYVSVADSLRRRIEDGQFAEGSRLPSEQSMQDVFGVSRVTVRKAIELLLDEGWLLRRPNRGLVPARRRLGPADGAAVQLVFDPALNGSFEHVSGHLSGLLLFRFAAHAGGIHLTALPPHGRFADWARNASGRLARRVLFWGGYEPSAEDEAVLGQCGAMGVVIGRAGPDCGIPQVNGDHFQCALTVTRHLMSLGHRRIAIMGGTPGHVIWDGMLDGVRRALATAGATLDDELLFPVTEPTIADGERFGGEFLARGTGATALLANGDNLTCGFMRVMRRRGVRVPRDLAVVVMKYKPWLDDACRIPMTGIEESNDMLIDTALKTFEAMEAGRPVPPNQVIANMTMTIRRSCGAIRCDASDSDRV